MSDSTYKGRAATATAAPAVSSKGARAAVCGNSWGRKTWVHPSQLRPTPPPLLFADNQPFMLGAEPGGGEGTSRTRFLSSWSLETPSEQVTDT